ncbi:MAG TPA: DUF5335 family protein [Pyrinomonadaceae bacterium]|jgi:hypothetical protein|nr:DUF5335 family protein [Pyrinomonadaceae bacterium]
MKTELRREEPGARWEPYLREFNRQNGARLTRLGVMKSDGGVEDLWLEDGLQLSGIDLDTEGDEAPSVEIMLGGEGASGRNVTRTVVRARKVVIRLDAEGRGEGLDIEDSAGATTVLRFETRSTE